ERSTLQCPVGWGDATGLRRFFRESGLRRFLALAKCGVEPGPGERPVAVGGAADDAQRPGRLLERKAGEEAKFDQLGTDRVFLRQLFQGLVEDEKLVRGFLDGEVDVVEAQSPPAAA